MEGFESFVGIDFWTALFTLCNMIITFLLLKKFLFGPVMKMIAERQKEIDDQYAAAEKAKTEAESLRQEYSRMVEDNASKRDSIIREATERGRNREDEIIAEAKSQAAQIIDRAQASIELEKKKALNEIRDEVTDLAVSIARKVTEKDIDDSDKARLVNDFIDKLGE